jgi:3-hydroxyacyl-[acyl-carrier-protein] dehydratase
VTSIPTPLEPEAVRALLPYRPPMLMIDRVLGWSDEGIVAEKYVRASDPVVAGHLIHGPHVMPGVLLIELVGQAAYLHALLRDGAAPDSEGPPPARLLGRCKARFLHPAPVGSCIVAEVTQLGRALHGALHHGRLMVDDQVIAEIEVLSAVAAAAPAAGGAAREEG